MWACTIHRNLLDHIHIGDDMSGELEKSIFQRIVKAHHSGLDKMIIGEDDIKSLVDSIYEIAEEQCRNEKICPTCWKNIDGEDGMYCVECDPELEDEDEIDYDNLLR